MRRQRRCSREASQGSKEALLAVHSGMLLVLSSARYFACQSPWQADVGPLSLELLSALP